MKKPALVAGSVVLAGFVVWAVLFPSTTVQGDCPPPPFPKNSCPFDAAGYLTYHHTGTRILIVAVGVILAATTVVAGLVTDGARRRRVNGGVAGN